MSPVQNEAFLLLRVDDFEAEAAAGDLARISHLPAALAVEGRAVEDDEDRLGVADFINLFAELALSDDADHLPLGFRRLVAEEFRVIPGLREGIERVVVAEQLALLAAARFFAVLLHLAAKAFPVES